MKKKERKELVERKNVDFRINARKDRSLDRVFERSQRGRSGAT